MKKSHEKLWDLLASEGKVPTKQAMNEWDEEITAIFTDKERHARLARNIWLLMAMNDLTSKKELATVIGYDAAHVSRIINGTSTTQSNVVCFYTIATKLKVNLDTLLKADLTSDLQEAIRTHEKQSKKGAV